VRVSAKELTSLLLDEERLRQERNDRRSWKSRVHGIEDSGSSEQPAPRRAPRPQRDDEEDAEYRLALEASKYQEEEDRRTRQSRGGDGHGDDDLARALRLSKEEEERRRRELDESLFDAPPPPQQQQQQMLFTGNQGYQQQGAVDWSGNPIEQLQTGYPAFIGAQPTGYQSFAAGFVGQPTGYDAFAPGPQAYAYEAATPGYAHEAATPGYAHEAATPGYTAYTGTAPANAADTAPGSNNPWARAQPALQPTPTGSNNPFAARQSAPSAPSLPQSSVAQSMPPSSVVQPSVVPSSAAPHAQTPYEAKLSALLNSGEGIDTFGNTGNLRIPAQHTAPGSFVNSAGVARHETAGRAAGAGQPNPFNRSGQDLIQF
jgi:epsin